MRKFVAPVVLALGLSMIGGCATVSKEEFEAVRTAANKAAADAAAAKADAAAARTDAAAAKDAAGKASGAAAKAQSSADVANTCCQDTQTKIDRMFKKSMYK